MDALLMAAMAAFSSAADLASNHSATPFSTLGSSGQPNQAGPFSPPARQAMWPAGLAASAPACQVWNMPQPPCPGGFFERSEEHTSELQSQSNLVCRLLLEKKKKKHT